MLRTSQLELLLATQIEQAGLPEPMRELRFHDTRRWRFDFAWPDAMLAVEVEGGVWIRGRHNRGRGFVGDCEKYNAATLLGWRVLRYTSSAIEDGTAILEIEEVLSG